MAAPFWEFRVVNCEIVLHPLYLVLQTPHRIHALKVRGVMPPIKDQPSCPGSAIMVGAGIPVNVQKDITPWLVTCFLHFWHLNLNLAGVSARTGEGRGGTRLIFSHLCFSCWG